MMTKTSKPVTIRFPVSDDLLDQLGVSVQDLSAASFDDVTKTWKQDASFSYDATTKTLSVSVSHFSIWALTANRTRARATRRPTSPTATASTSRRASPSTGPIAWK